MADMVEEKAKMMQGSPNKRAVIWLLCWLPVGVWLSGKSCLYQELGALELPMVAVRGVVGPSKRGAKEAGPGSQRAVIIVDIGSGWSQSHRWAALERERRCMQLWKAVQATLALGGEVVGIDLLLGRDRRGRPHTCSPQSVRERAWWGDVIKRSPERIVLPVSLALPKHVRLVGQELQTSLAGTRHGHPIRLSGPSMVPGAQKLARGHVALFAQQGTLRQAWQRLVLPLASTGHSPAAPGASSMQQPSRRDIPAMAAEVVRLARQRAALRNAGAQGESSVTHSPMVIHWERSQVQLFHIQHLRAPAVALRRQFRGAIVFFGAAMQPMRDDIFHTPMGLLSGVQVHAHIAATMLYGPQPARIHWAFGWLVLLGCWVMGVFLGWSLWPWFVRLLAGLCLFVGLWFIAAYVVHVYGWIPPAIGGTGGFLLGLVTGLYERLRRERDQRRELQDKIYLAIHPHRSERERPTPENANETPEHVGHPSQALLLQRYPRPIASLVAQTLESRDLQAKSLHTIALYRTVMAYGCALLQQICGAARPLHFSDAPGNEQYWRELASKRQEGAAMDPQVEALVRALSPTAEWEQRAIAQMQRAYLALLDVTQTLEPEKRPSFYEWERIEQECRDLLNWCLLERLTAFAELPLVWVESVPFPEAHLPLCQDPWKQLWQGPTLAPQMGVVGTSFRETQELPEAQGLQCHHLYIICAARYIPLSPYWLLAPTKEATSPAFFCLEEAQPGLVTKLGHSKSNPHYASLQGRDALDWTRWSLELPFGHERLYTLES